MCGFVGTISAVKKVSISEIKNAARSIEHRGPDSFGLWNDTLLKGDGDFDIILAHVRLAIIDLSDQGNQPMVSRSNTVIVYNGEIYNYLEIKRELVSLGCDFSSNTDTEVILAAYEQWGDRCVEKFIGMWAFAIWDGKNLFISRDRLGQKPLYYYFSTENQTFVFASEIKALGKIVSIPWEANERTMFRFLNFSEMESEGNTFYKDIKEFPPASCLSYEPGQNKLDFRNYWSLPNEQFSISEREAERTTYEILRDSVRLRLRSDAPIGLSLSGGLDSTLLLSIINELGHFNFPVFSSGYTERGYNEIKYIKIALAGGSCKPHENFSDKSSFTHDFEKHIYHLDQPSKLAGTYSQWRIAKHASSKVRVLIDGQGADELAGGYQYFLPAMWIESKLIEKIRNFPDILLTLWHNQHVLRQYPPGLICERLLKKANADRKTPLRKEWIRSFRDERPKWTDKGSLDSALRRAILETSLPALLRYGDRNYMAFGLEGRSPFLDHRLIEFVSSLPLNMKIRGGTTKWVFRKIAENKIPEAILKRRVKMGFPTPVGKWYREEIYYDTKNRLNDYMKIPLFSRWIDGNLVLNLFEQHAAGKVDHQALLWRILSVGAWLKVTGVS